MNKLLILSTLLFCLTASPKTFSAQKEYRLIQYKKEGVTQHVILENDITLDQTIRWLNENGNTDDCFYLFDCSSKVFKKFTTPYSSFEFNFDWHLFSDINFLIQIMTNSFEPKENSMIYVLRIKDIFSQAFSVGSGEINSIETIPINAVTNIQKALDKDLTKKDDDDINSIDGNDAIKNITLQSVKNPIAQSTPLPEKEKKSHDDDDDINSIDGSDTIKNITLQSVKNSIAQSTPLPEKEEKSHDDDDDINSIDGSDAIKNITLQSVKNSIAQSTLLPEEQKEFDNDDDDNDDVQQLSSLQPISSEKEGSMGKASKNEKTDISMDPNNSPFTIGKPEDNTSSNNEEKDDNSSTSSGINSYHIGSVIILVGVLFFVVLNWSKLSKSSNSSKKESIDNAH